MLIYRKSPVTGQMNAMDIDVTEEQLFAWHSGGLIQDIVPNLSPSEREFLISGSTEEDWSEMFGEED